MPKTTHAFRDRLPPTVPAAHGLPVRVGTPSAFRRSAMAALAVPRGAKFQHRDRLVELGHGPEHLTDQGPRRVLVARGQVHAVSGQQGCDYGWAGEGGQSAG